MEPAGGHQQGLVGQIQPFQVGELVAQHHLVHRLALRQQEHRANEAQHHGGADLPAPADRDRTLQAQTGRRLPCLLLRLQVGPGVSQQPPAGQQIPASLHQGRRQRAKEPQGGQQSGDGDGSDRRSRRRGRLAGLSRRFLRWERSGQIGGWRASWERHLIAGGLHRHRRFGQREVHRDHQTQGQNEPDHVQCPGPHMLPQPALSHQQGDQHRRAGQRDPAHPQKQRLHLLSLLSLQLLQIGPQLLHIRLVQRAPVV